MKGEVLSVKDLRVYYHTGETPVKAVDGVTFTLHDGERFGLVGESGSGKSTAAFGILRLIKPPARIESGSVMLDGKDLLKLSNGDMNRVRFAQIALIPQGAMNSLNPVMRIREQLTDGIQTHDKSISKQEMNERTDTILEMVGLRRQVARMYPHELSGGMQQRVCIAMAIALRPRVIIADEPTSALDVVTQRQVMETIGRVQEELGAAVILIGHDMGLMVQFVNRLAVMYGGKIAELGTVQDLFTEPLHPYTQLLIHSLPRLEERGELQGIPGIAPSLLNAPPGCLFHMRCPEAMEICRRVTPPPVELRPQHIAACHLYEAVTAAANGQPVSSRAKERA